MKRPKWLLTSAVACSIVLIAFKFSDPFGWPFFLGFFGFFFSAGFLLFLVALHLLLVRTWLKIVLGIMALLPGIVLIVAGVLFAIDYRLLLPGFHSEDPTQEDWQADYLTLKEELLKHPAFRDSLDETFLADSTDFRQLGPPQSLVALMKLAGRLPDGHTYIHPLQPAVRSRYVPLVGYLFDDGYYILRAANRYEDLVGKKVISINGTPIKELVRRIMPLAGPENAWQGKFQLDLYIFSTTVLTGLGILASDDECNIEVEDGDGLVSIRMVGSVPFANWFFWAFRPIRATEISPALVNLRSPDFYVEYDSVHRLLLIPFHTIRNQRPNAIADLAADIDTLALLRRPLGIVLDLRNSLGGDNTLYESLVTTLAALSKSVPIYVFISRKTFSASVNLLSELKAHAKVTLVGEPTGAGPNHYGDARHLFLPKTRISLLISTRKWAFDPRDNHRYYWPDIPVTYNYEDYASGRDPWIEAISR